MEEPGNPLGFGQWQWVEAESTFALKAQGWAPFSEEFVRVTGPVINLSDWQRRRWNACYRAVVGH
jgi:hypothetical protein